jgi:hypothetical protein
MPSVFVVANRIWPVPSLAEVAPTMKDRLGILNWKKGRAGKKEDG